MIAATVTGTLGKDPKTSSHEGTPILSFSVASRRFAKGAEETDWVECSVWGKRAESLASLLRKGAKVAVRGALGVRKYTTGDGRPGFALEMRADDVDVLAKGNG